MRVHSLGRGFFLLSLLLVVGFSHADQQTFEVVGVGECGDCEENNFKTSQAFSGLHVTIDCRLKNGEMRRIGAGELDKQGKFKILLPQELKEDCYAQLHSAAAIPCPAHNGLEASKVVLISQTNGKKTFGPTKTLRFSSALCTSKFLWPYFKYPPLKKNLPPLKNFGHPWPVPTLPPPSKPKPKPDLPIPKPPKKPSTPIYKPKPLPPPLPKPPKKPSSPPISKPKPKPPVVSKPLPPPLPLYPIPPIFYKKPCPPLPKIPPKYFLHPKFGYFPPLPPSIPHP